MQFDVNRHNFVVYKKFNRANQQQLKLHSKSCYYRYKYILAYPASHYMSWKLIKSQPSRMTQNSFHCNSPQKKSDRNRTGLPVNSCFLFRVSNLWNKNLLEGKQGIGVLINLSSSCKSLHNMKINKIRRRAAHLLGGRRIFFTVIILEKKESKKGQS